MYIFKDIKDFLKKHYNLEWRDYKVNDNREIRKVKVSDIKLKSRSAFRAGKRICFSDVNMSK